MEFYLSQALSLGLHFCLGTEFTSHILWSRSSPLHSLQGKEITRVLYHKPIGTPRMYLPSVLC